MKRYKIEYVRRGSGTLPETVYLFAPRTVQGRRYPCSRRFDPYLLIRAWEIERCEALVRESIGYA